MAKKYVFIALDVGTHAVRACVFSLGGDSALWQVSEVFSCDISLDSPQSRHIEQSPTELWQALTSVYSQALNLATSKQLYTKDIHVGMAVQRSSVLVWERISGQALSPILSWQDTRGYKAIEQLNATERKNITLLTGLRPSPHYGATKLALLQKEYGLPAQTRPITFGPLAAWLIKQLTDNNTCDPVNAARTLLFNRKQARWDKSLCRMFNVMHAQLPNLKKSADYYGHIKWPNSEHFNKHYSGNAHLQAVLGDQNAAYVAMRHSQLPAAVTFKKPLVMNIGSGAFILGQCNKDNNSDTLGLLTSLAFSDNNNEQWLMEGTVNSAGTALSHWRESLAEPLSEHSLFAQLPQWLLNDSHCENNEAYFYLNTAAGIGSPFWLTRFSSSAQVFVNDAGERCTPSIPQQAAAIINSIAFLLVANILQFRQAPEASRYDGILATGGLSRVTGLIERVSDLCGLPIFVTKCHEATLHGTAMLGSNFMYKPRIQGHIVAAKKSSPVLLQRYERYIQLIKMQAL
ncbi:FGGY family carbohydrate kinase [Marinagarivorans cellulosilyticus]|uniref:Glycerol kinase n=1 Tax=Marinagarivorans cellulosilyticus TaxID=2721545 RepID=A0AAN2BM61_9GAMM|nr:FGGY family carbohydrate kinase [Marinagarivorans cellulosilyticus]BCD99814.1 glycerol kinase [Marinagarivorans cellulosilyticus]